MHLKSKKKYYAFILKKTLLKKLNGGVQFRKWCTYLLATTKHKKYKTNPVLEQETDSFEENKRLRGELPELKNENLFFKKAVAFFAKEID